MEHAVRTPWEVLGVAEDTPFDEVRKAFFRRARATHPDLPGGDADAFRQVKAAFDTIVASRPRERAGTAPRARTPRRNPYAAWDSPAARSRVWVEDDPLLDRIGAPAGSQVDFGRLIAAEIGRLNLRAA
jgi:curved DNA-binding protein CbpA